MKTSCTDAGEPTGCSAVNNVLQDYCLHNCQHEHFHTVLLCLMSEGRPKRGRREEAAGKQKLMKNGNRKHIQH